jgi:hypothetical protein
MDKVHKPITTQQIVTLRMISYRSKHVVLYNKWNLVVFGRISTRFGIINNTRG